MKKHLIALDLDGTLLKDDNTISRHNKKAIEKAIKNGHIVVISTGRPHRASIEYYHTLNLDTPMINFNGALIHHPTDIKWDVLHNPMPLRTAQQIIDVCHDFGVNNILAEVMDNIYLDHYDEQIMSIFTDDPEESPFTIGSLKSNLTNDPTSLLINPQDYHINQLLNHLDNYHAEFIEHRQWGITWNIVEIVKKGLNKAVGLKKLAHYYDIPESRIIAFGDENNDLEMINYAGVGVAMENAINDLKSVANYVTESNENDGISHFLNDYLDLLSDDNKISP